MEHQEKKLHITKIPNHLALILDGNGRWALKRGLKRYEGHQKGIETLGEIARAAFNKGLKYLSAYVFSTDNFKRSSIEVNFLMSQAKNYFKKYLDTPQEKEEYTLHIIGELTNLDDELKLLIEKVNNKNSKNSYHLILAFNYGSQEEIVNVTKKIAYQVKEGNLDVNDITKDIISKNLYTNAFPPVDFLIRTSGEVRLSNFMLWQLSYSELYFTDVLWPDFNSLELEKALIDFEKRERRFGKEHT